MRHAPREEETASKQQRREASRLRCLRSAHGLVRKESTRVHRETSAPLLQASQRVVQAQVSSDGAAAD